MNTSAGPIPPKPPMPPMPTTPGPTGPAFSAPWQAQAFAMTLALHERGLFSWAEWTETLAEAIRSTKPPSDADAGDIYYRQWLDALETLVVRKGLAHHEQLHALEHAWERAAARTPHGRPIELSDDDRVGAHD